MRIPYYRIEAYLSGTLSAERSQGFEKEIAANPELSQVVREQRSIVCKKRFEELFPPGLEFGARYLH